MADDYEIPDLDDAGLRRFGLTMAVIVAGLFGILLPWVLERAFPLWPWIAGGAFTFLGVAVPSRLRSVYRVWFRLGLLLNRFMSPVILSVVYYLVVTPMGLARRLLGLGLPMHRDAEAETYRVKARKSRPEDLERPF